MVRKLAISALLGFSIFTNQARAQTCALPIVRGLCTDNTPSDAQCLTYVAATQSQHWASCAAGGGITGTGTTNALGRWTGSTALGNSVITESGAVDNLNGNTLTGGRLLDKGGAVKNVLAYGAVCDGVADDTTVIQAAIDDVRNAGGGTVYFPTRAGNYALCVISTVLDLGNYTGHTTHAVRLMGAGNQGGVYGNTNVTLLWTGGAGSGPMLKAYGAQNLEIDHLDLAYNNVAYDGNLIDVRQSPGNGTCAGGSQAGLACLRGADCPASTCSSTQVGLATTAFFTFHDGRAGGRGVTGPATLFRLDWTEAAAFEHNLFERASSAFDATPIAAAAVGEMRSNDIVIRENTFGAFTGSPILAAGDQWTILGNDFSGEGAPARAFDTAAANYPVLGLLYHGNWHTTTGNAGTWFQTTGGKVQGASINGNRFENGGVALNFTNAGPSKGVVVAGNSIGSQTTGIITGSAGAGAPIDVMVMGNTFTSTTPISGTFAGAQIVANGTTLIERSVTDDGATLTVVDGVNLATGTTTGIKIGTATTQKLGFYNASPIVQPAVSTDLVTVLQNLGFVASGTYSGNITTTGRLNVGTNPATGATSANSINMPNLGEIDYRNAANSANFRLIGSDGANVVQIGEPSSGGITLGNTNINIRDGAGMVLGTTTGAKIGTATTQKLGFYNSTPVVQPAASTELFAALNTSSGGLGLIAGTTASNPITTTGAVTHGSLTVNTSVLSGTGMQHKRKGSAGCATSGVLDATCTDTITWGTAFANTSYTAVCQCDGITSGVPIAYVTSKAASTVTVTTTGLTATAAQCSDLDCIAMHD